MKYNFKIETGTFVGTGSARSVEPVCDGPDFVLTKRINGTATAAYTLWDRMPRNLANSFGGSFAEKANQLTDLTKDGFYVGGGQSQNTALYAYVAMKSVGAGRHFQTGRYYGDGADNRNLQQHEGTFFLPDFMYTHIAFDGNPGRCRFSPANVGDASQTFTAFAGVNGIQSFLADGFQLGTTVNTASQYFNWFAMRSFASGCVFGQFIGNGGVQTISVGWRPTFVLVHNITSGLLAHFLTKGMVDNNIGSHPVSAIAADPNAITGFTDTGFSVGPVDNVNASGAVCAFWAMRDGEYALPAGRRLA